MSGKIKELIDRIIQERSKGNPGIVETTKAKLILKGINPNKFDSNSEDDRVIIEKLFIIAEQLNIKIQKHSGKNIIYLFSKKFSENEVVSDIKNSLNCFDVKMLIYFASSIYNQDKLSSMMHEAFKGSIVFGCSTAGEIINGELLKDSVVAMAFNSNVVSDIKIEVIENMKNNINIEPAFQAFEKHFNESPFAMDTEKYVGLILVDGLSIKAEDVMDSIGNRTNILFIGGSAGDDLKYVRTYVYANGKAYTDSAVLALLKINDNAEFSIIKTQSFKQLDHVFTATKVKTGTREVIDFNNRPALIEYGEAVGAASVLEAPLYFSSNPVGLIIGEKDILVRTPMRVDGTAIDFYSNILEGMEVRLLAPTDIIDDTRKSIENNISKFGFIDALINFNCTSRTVVIEKRNLEREYAGIYSKIPSIGFSTYGEEYIGHINQSSVMLVFRTKNKYKLNAG
jgi:hypothetical protein